MYPTDVKGSISNTEESTEGNTSPLFLFFICVFSLIEFYCSKYISKLVSSINHRYSVSEPDDGNYLVVFQSSIS